MALIRLPVFVTLSLMLLTFSQNVQIESAAVGEVVQANDDMQAAVNDLVEQAGNIKDAQEATALKINSMKTQAAAAKVERQTEQNDLRKAQAIAHAATQAQFEALEASGRAKIEALKIAQQEATTRAEKQLSELEMLLEQNKALSEKLAKFMNPQKMGDGEKKVSTSSETVFHSDGGAGYVRWGRTVCSGDATVLYDGYAATSMWNVYGGGSNLLCMHKDPLLSENITSVNKDFIHGIEYNFVNAPFITGENCDQVFTFGDMPCVVCQMQTRSHQLMIPGVDNCPAGWTLEYYGFLVSSLIAQHKMDYTCLDKSPETVPNGIPDALSRYIYPVEAVCGGSLPCPPYVAGYGIPCVVCSK